MASEQSDQGLCESTEVPLNLSEHESQLLARVDNALAGGVELRNWWLERDATDSYPNRYEEGFVFNRPEDHSFGFIGTAPLSRGPLRVNGNIQQMFYDAPKTPNSRQATDWVCAQLREFILHYFMRISDYRLPEEVPDRRAREALPFLRPFCQCPKNDPQIEGFGFTQLFYKSAATREIGRFPPERQKAIVNLLELGEVYDWILLQNPIFNFDLKIAPLGPNGPQFVLPLNEFNYLVISRDFVVDEQHPEPGVLAKYGLGYAFVRNPSPSIFAYGPGQLEPTFEQLNWKIMDDGRIISRFAFVAQEPTGLLNISLDPLQWGWRLADAATFGAAAANLQPLKRMIDMTPMSRLKVDPVFPAVRLLNLLTAGQAGKQLCISRLDIIKGLLFVHFLQHYQMVVGSLQTWRQVRDWLDRESLPEFVITGKSG